ncbi:hypothetical protein ColTof4_01159 [Colletotrichum tofieldiae]|nr:hypothetical protein ColTof3_08385 [Colletotrichum tofieldiae]GKT68736.1 hypothetical protein ColTof4_01159 [Colletotrichum tofieldiae]
MSRDAVPGPRLMVFELNASRAAQLESVAGEVGKAVGQSLGCAAVGGAAMAGKWSGVEWRPGGGLGPVPRGWWGSFSRRTLSRRK